MVDIYSRIRYIDKVKQKIEANMKITNALAWTISALLTVATIYATSVSAQKTETEINGFDSELFKEEHCLALNIYYEARGSSFADKVAVSDVVLNRVKSTRFPNTICEVVQEGYVKGKRNCQFSWYCDGKSDIPQDQDSWEKAQSIAWAMSKWGRYVGITEGATNYHATYVNPSWARKLQFVGTIGAHKFYREHQ